MARRTLRRILIVLAGVSLIGVATWLIIRPSAAGTPSSPKLSREAMAPEGVRVRVQVVNASSVRGLARRATQVLRDHGFDVVEAGTGTEAQSIDSVLVLDRSGHPDWAQRVGLALGGARIESRPDSSRYLDVTVFVGRSWRPPAQPFYP
jgi:hypothetical protein